MSNKKHSPFGQDDVSFDDYDELVNPPPEVVEFDSVLERAVSRREFISTTGAGILSFGLGSLAVGTAAPLSLSASDQILPLEFEAVPASTKDTVIVPDGFHWDVLVSWGDPLWSTGSEFDPKTRGTAASQMQSMGDNNDGMDVFSDGEHIVMAVNNESVNHKVFHGNRLTNLPETEDDVLKSKAAHGVSVFEISMQDGRWQVVKDSRFNRKLTADQPMEITGPARGHALLKTSADPQGIQSLGTWNNCGNGITPWGTYLTCEENFNGYFSHDKIVAPVSDEFKRYGISANDRGYGWGRYDQRFRINHEPNEANRAGYVVEIDPLDPDSIPKKRTALGRFKHENAEVEIAKSGKVVVYLGDDERGEFLYRFVSKNSYQVDTDNSNLLEYGDLYVAKFTDDGRGEWLILNEANTGMSRAEISIHSRIAASKVGATTMDRPEWVASNPHKAQVFCCLTNNKKRGIKKNKGGDPTPVGGPNPRKKNKYGQILRWVPDEDQHDAPGFSWDLFVMAGNPDVHPDSLYGGSTNITSENKFNSPDGLHFDSKGGLWIQTDGNYSNKGDFAGMGNNQMLYADPDSGQIKRFMVGPNEAEITGTTWSPDRKTMFVGVQHPGAWGNSHFPDGGDTLPRSSIIAISRDDGSVIG